MLTTRQHVETAGHRLSVIRQRLSVTEAAARFGVSRQWAQVLLARYRDGGLDAVEPRSHRPRTNPRQTSPAGGTDRGPNAATSSHTAWTPAR